MTDSLEALAFGIGIKPALRLRLSRDRTAPEVRRWRRRGVAVVETAGLAYIARDEARARALARAEEVIRPGLPQRTPDGEVLAAHRELGRLLGYPACCVEAFLERVARGVDVLPDGSRASELAVAFDAALRRSERPRWELSFVLPQRRALVPFDPCALDCAIALRYATALLGAYRERDPDAAAELERRLRAPVRLTRDGVLLESDDPAEAWLEAQLEG